MGMQIMQAKLVFKQNKQAVETVSIDEDGTIQVGSYTFISDVP